MNFLLLASLFFYATWSIPFTLHFVGIVAINYYLLQIFKTKKWDWVFYFLQFINLTNLFFFKYFYFFAEMLGQIFEIPFLAEAELRVLHKSLGYEILLPLGISFYTFQVMGYGIDLKRKTYIRDHSFKEVMLFISFFPQLIAGPIMRSSELLPHISDYEKHSLGHVDPEKIKKGIWLILIGVVKKLFVADQISEILYFYVRSNPEDHNFLGIWLLCISFIVMLYSDFSAYSDLARGLGYLLGFEIPINFRAPFFMHSFTELWRRWHLTFAYWIRDYIFIPLGGSKEGEWKLYRNILITFSLGGLWHGASYTFLIWGFLMGTFLSLEAFLTKRGFSDFPKNIYTRIFRISVVWILYLSSGIFFFAPNIEWAQLALKKMFSVDSDFVGIIHREEISMIVVYFVFTLGLQWIEINPENFSKLRKYENLLLPIFVLIVFVAIVLFQVEKKDFFYFQF